MKQSISISQWHESSEAVNYRQKLLECAVAHLNDLNASKSSRNIITLIYGNEPINWFSQAIIMWENHEIIIAYQKNTFKNILAIDTKNQSFSIKQYVDEDSLILLETNKELHIDAFCQTFMEWYERNEEAITNNAKQPYHSDNTANKLAQLIV